MPKPSLTSYPVYYQQYTSQVPEEDLSTAFRNQLLEIKKNLSSVSEEKSLYAYDEGKWTLRELLQHLIDAERIFGYRALCIARKEKISLPGFDENAYATHSNANARTWQDMTDEFLTVRKTTEILFNSFTDDMLDTSGTSNNNPITPRSLGFIIIGHFYHHKKIMEERYLSGKVMG